MTVNIVEAGPRQISRSVEVDAPAAELFAMAADPRRHRELDGSGTVRDNVKAPGQITVGSKFSTNMKMYGIPYRIRSTVTGLKLDELVEWRHPEGHRWRWEFQALSPNKTLVTETFDYRNAGFLKRGFYLLTGSLKANVAGIERSLTKLRDRYAGGTGK